MSDTVDWSQSATMYERDDSGSDRDIDFRVVAKASLAELVAMVIAMDATARARIIIDRGPAGTIGYADIMALAARADYPGE